MFFKRRFFVITSFVLLAMLISTFGSAFAATAPSVSNVYTYPPDSAEQVTGAKSQLLRGDGEVKLHFNTKGLDPGGAYTVWIVAFNNPEGCSDGVCDGGDLGNLAADPSAFWGTGKVIDNEGGAGNFWLTVEEGVFPGQRLFGAGVLDAQETEIHWILQYHGQASDDPDDLYEQLNMFEGGCNPSCVDVQFAVHRP